MKLNLKAENANEQRVLDYLEANASEVLVEKINAGNKTLKGFFGYASGEAQKLAINGCACIEDKTVFGWAIHYFEEEEIKEPAKVIKATEAAKTPAELVYEGKYLHHCVGDMGYDAKMSKEKTLIFFIRKTAEPSVPYVTAEINPKSGKLLQCYGDHDTKPDDDVMSFVNEQWLPRIENLISKGAMKYDCAV